VAAHQERSAADPDHAVRGGGSGWRFERSHLRQGPSRAGVPASSASGDVDPAERGDDRAMRIGSSLFRIAVGAIA
ncbi:MAG TPA: hypothetical protein VFG79_03550, partial [Solirubrobacter sp.]|nr:hypothetical protein [Solirubrobacter sp.]